MTDSHNDIDCPECGRNMLWKNLEKPRCPHCSPLPKDEVVESLDPIRLLHLLASIRAAAGDREGKMMPAELVNHVAHLRQKAEAAPAEGLEAVAWIDKDELEALRQDCSTAMVRPAADGLAVIPLYTRATSSAAVLDKITPDRHDGPRTSAYVNGWNDAVDAVRCTQSTAAGTEGAKTIIDRVIAELESGFVVCERCGDQEDTATLDCMGDLKTLQAILTTQPKMDEPDPVVWIDPVNIRRTMIACPGERAEVAPCREGRFTAPLFARPVTTGFDPVMIDGLLASVRALLDKLPTMGNPVDGYAAHLEELYEEITDPLVPIGTRPPCADQVPAAWLATSDNDGWTCMPTRKMAIDEAESFGWIPTAVIPLYAHPVASTDTESGEE